MDSATLQELEILTSQAFEVARSLPDTLTPMEHTVLSQACFATSQFSKAREQSGTALKNAAHATFKVKLANELVLAQIEYATGSPHRGRKLFERAVAKVQNGVHSDDIVGVEEEAAKAKILLSWAAMEIYYRTGYEQTGDLITASLKIAEKLPKTDGAIQLANHARLMKADVDSSGQPRELDPSIRESMAAPAPADHSDLNMGGAPAASPSTVARASPAIEMKLGTRENMASDYCDIAQIYQKWGELDRAEESHQKALAILEKLGHQRGIAAQHGNLGSVAKDRGDFVRTRELWTKARDLYGKIAMPHMVKQLQGLIDELPAE